MNDLDTLRPEVQAAMIRLESYLHITIGGKHFRSEDYDTIRAELLRLTAVEQKWKQWINDGMRVVVSEQPK